jgi:hypothetical protein
VRAKNLTFGARAIFIAVLLLPGMISLLRDVEPLHQREAAEHKTHGLSHPARQ